MNKIYTIALALALALVNIGTTSAANIKGTKMSFSTGWNANMAVPATETRVYTFMGQWESASTSLSGIDTEIYKSFTVDCEATEGAWFNTPVTDGNGNAHYPGFAGDGQRGEHTITFSEIDGGIVGPLSGFGIQNCSASGTKTELKVYNAYLTKQNGAKEGVALAAAQWTSGSSFAFANPITASVVNFTGQWGGLNLAGANNIECGIKIRLYTKDVIPYDNIQYCVKFADDNSDGWPQLTKITDNYAECIIDRPLSSLALQWRATVAGSMDIEAITYERLDGQSSGEETETEAYSFHYLTDVPVAEGTKSLSTQVMRGVKHNTVLAPIASSLAFNPAEEGAEAPKSILVAIKNFDGTKVCLATVKTLDDLLVFEAEKALEKGDYTVSIAKNTLIIDDVVCDEELSFIIAVGDKDDAAEAALSDLEDEIGDIKEVQDNLIYGVNIYQYTPATKDKIQTLIDDAWYYGNLFVEEEHVYYVTRNLRNDIRDIKPIQPSTKKEYYIQHKATGLYLNLSGDNVTLEKVATPVQFHLTNAADGLISYPDADITQTDWTWHYAYIYNTADKEYLGFNANADKLVTTNKQNTIWCVNAFDFNTWSIEISGYDHDWNWDYLFGSKDSKEGNVVGVDDNQITQEEYQAQTFGGYWFIGEYQYLPEEAQIKPVVIEVPEGYAAITSENDLEGKTVILMNVETSEFIYGSNAQNIAVADFATATASTNVVTAYKVEKADNGYLFRCVTPAGADYALWGQNPCYFNSQPNAGGVTFNLGKNQDVENGSVWTLTYDDAVKAWTVQNVANNAYLAGTTVSADLTAKWVICASTTAASSAEATAISAVNAAANAVEVYNAAGARVNGLQKGMNIVKLANGKVVKIMK